LFCHGNRLPFSSLATGLHVNDFSYNPQDTIFDPYAIAVNLTLDYSAEALIDDTATHFIFYKDDVEAETNTTGLFSTTGAGTYCCQMTNARFPGLALTTAGITVTGETPGLELSVSSLNLDADANSTATFNILSNTSWDVISSQNWLTVNPDSGINNQTITLTAEENPDETTRDATVTVSGTGVTSKTLLVTQEGNNISAFIGINYNADIVYPNPVKDKINFSSPEKITEISVFSLSGIELIKTNNIADGIDVSWLDKGIYLIRLKVDDKIRMQEVVIE